MADKSVTPLEIARSHGFENWSDKLLLAIDPSRTKRLEDAFVTARADSEDAVALNTVVSLQIERSGLLQPGKPTICLGIQDLIAPDGCGLRPAVKLVVAGAKLVKLSDKDADKLLTDRHEEVKLPKLPEIQPEMLRDCLGQARQTAGLLSQTEEPMPADKIVRALMQHSQQAVVRASRCFEKAPFLIVLCRRENSVVNPETARRARSLKSPRKACCCVDSSEVVPEILAPDEPHSHQPFRIKNTSISGSINAVQITCALLGVEPLPQWIVKKALAPNSKLDRSEVGSMHGRVRKEIQKKRAEIWEFLQDQPVS